MKGYHIQKLPFTLFSDWLYGERFVTLVDSDGNGQIRCMRVIDGIIGLGLVNV